jgi:hypothetical protein
MKTLTKARRYRLTEREFSRLELLKKYNIKESGFVRDAIAEKFERDLPKLVKEQKRMEDFIKCPF